MKKLILLLTLTVLSLSAVYANSESEDHSVNEAYVEMDQDKEFAKVDDRIFCTVAMVNRQRRIMRRYHGTRSYRSFRCERPMRRCLQDLRWRRVRFARCVELR